MYIFTCKQPKYIFSLIKSFSYPNLNLFSSHKLKAEEQIIYSKHIIQI